MMSFAGGQNSNKLLMTSKNICQSLQCWFLLSKIGRSIRWWHFHCFGASPEAWWPREGGFLPQQTHVRCRDQVPWNRKALPLLILYMYKASSYFALGGNNCCMQIGCHKAHTVGSCPESPTWKMDVCIVRIRYPISACKGSQGAGTGGSHCRQGQHWCVHTFLYVPGPCSLTDRLMMMGAA